MRDGRLPRTGARREGRRDALDRGHELLVDGVACVMLGHGLQGAVVGHTYWGTDAVLADLSRQPGWAQGFVLLRPGQLGAAGAM